MNENEARFWTVIFGAITSLGLIEAGIYTLVQYTGGKQKDRETQMFQIDATNLSSRQYFNNKLLDSCSAVATVAATIATGQDSQRSGAMDAFWTHYWGDMRIVAGPRVGASLDEFARCLKAKNGVPSPREIMCKPFEQLAADIGLACQTEVVSGYKLKRDAWRE